MEKLSFWADVSTIWLMLLAFIMGIVPLVIIYFAVRGMMIVNKTVPRYLKLGQYYSGIVRDQTHKLADKVTDPVVRVYGEANRVEQTARHLVPRDKSKQP